jgi:hypothetical protein
MHYAGIEKVDPAQRQAQHALTAALWERLSEQGVRARSTGNIEAFLWADEEGAAASLGGVFADGKWGRELAVVDGRFRVKLTTPEIVLTPQAFHELVDVMMVAAVEHGCTFDGFQVDLNAVRRRPWWQIW